jgi:hypothetical protein
MAALAVDAAVLLCDGAVVFTVLGSWPLRAPGLTGLEVAHGIASCR